jgi:ribose transport system permease protein
MRKIFDAQLLGPAIALAVVCLVIALTTRRFLDPGNLANLSLQVSIVALVAIGSTFVIIAGGIDLSAGSMTAFLTMILAVIVKERHVPLWLAVPAILVLGGVMGAFNGVVSSYLRIPSFITTLAGLIAFRGAALLFNNGSPMFAVSPQLGPLFYGKCLGIPLPFYYIVALFGAASLFAKYTKLGREIYAIGGNPSAARLSGINVPLVQTLSFTVAGIMTAVGAALFAARLNSGSPNYGVTLELQAIAAAVVGGASLSGGRGNVLASLFGALTIVVVQNALNLNAVPTAIQNIVLGLIILIAVGIDMWRRELAAVFLRLFRADKRGVPGRLASGDSRAERFSKSNL